MPSSPRSRTAEAGHGAVALPRQPPPSLACRTGCTGPGSGDSAHAPARVASCCRVDAEGWPSG